MTTTEKNKLIAEFISKKSPFNKGHYICPNGIATKPEYMKFHSSWDWLMPVVEKIESLGYEVKIGRISCQVHEILKENSPISSLVCGNISKKIDLVYDVCVNFIQWYNQNKHN